MIMWLNEGNRDGIPCTSRPMAVLGITGVIPRMNDQAKSKHMFPELSI